MNLKEELEEAIKSGWLYLPKPILDESIDKCEQIAIRYAIEVLEEFYMEEGVMNKIKELKSKLK